METKKESPQVAPTTGEDKDTWYFRKNKLMDIWLPAFALAVSIIVLIITLNSN